MVTYMISFIVCNYHRKHYNLPSPVNLSVYYPDNEYFAESYYNYPLEVANSLLNYFNGYLDEKYPLPKLDLITIPDLNMDAVEHWGLIIFKLVISFTT